MFFHARLLFLAITLVLLAPLAAVAQDERADELTEEALALREQGDDRAAMPLLEEAHALRPTPRSAAQLGLVHQALGNWVGAATHLTEALAAENNRWIRRNRAALREALEFVEQHVGRIELDVSVEGAEVRVDGDLRGSSPLAQIVANTGTVEVVVSRAGYRTVTRSIVVTAGELSREQIEMREGSDDPDPEYDRIAPDSGGDGATGSGSGRLFAGKLWTWVAAGVAVGAGVAAALVWWRANEDYDSLIGPCEFGCTPDETSGVRTLVTLTNVLLVTSIVAGAAAVTLFFIEGSGDEEEDVEIAIGPGNVLVRGRF